MVKTLPLLDALKTLTMPGLDRNLFSSPDWLNVVCKTYRCHLYVKYIERDGNVASYIVYSIVKNFLEWKICVCSYCDYFDCYIDRADDWTIFFNQLRAEYPEYRITVRNLRDHFARENPNFQVLSKERFHFLDVRGSIESIWKKTHDSFKSAVKQGQKNGIKIKRCDKEDLPKFFALHLSLRKNKYRLFPQPYCFFTNIWDQYLAKDRGVFLGAFDPQDNMIGATIYLICGDTLYYKFNTSRLGSLRFRPNNVLFWEGIKFAKERDLKYIDLGSSGYQQDGLILFKNHTGAQIQDIIHLGFAPAHYKFSQKRILKAMTWLFTLPWTPAWLVRFGSNLIYPFLA